MNLTKALSQRAIETGELPESLSFDVLLAIEHALATAFINAGPDIAHLYQGAYCVEVDRALVRYLATKALSGKLELEFEKRASALPEYCRRREGEMAKVAFYVAAIKNLLIGTIEKMASKTSLLQTDPMQVSRNEVGIPILNDQPDQEEFEFKGSKDEFNLATFRPDGYDGIKADYDGLKADQAVVIPAGISASHILEKLQEERRGFLDVRGLEREPYNVLADSVAIDTKGLKMFESADEPAMIAAAAQSRADSTIKTPSHRRPQLRLIDASHINAEHDARNDISFEQAVERGLPIMDLDTFLVLSTTPEYAYLQDNTHPVALNCVLPDGRLVTAAWGNKTLYFDSKAYRHGSQFRVFPAQ